MEVESVPNRGTTIRFNLPVRQAGRPAPEPEEELVS
jgi:signal transduction histidine kinase